MENKILKLYKVSWCQKGKGQYIPLDPCCGGDYYSDLYGFDLVPACTKKDAKEIVTTLRVPVTIKGITLIKTIGKLA